MERFFLLQGFGDRHGPQRGWWGQSPHGLAFAVAFFAPQGHDVRSTRQAEPDWLSNDLLFTFYSKCLSEIVLGTVFWRSLS